MGIEIRYKQRVEVDTNGCWLWQSTLDREGYPIWGGPRALRNRRAHRMMYELEVGPIPDGLPLDHLCFVRRCVNPAHLEPVTPKENTRRMVAAGRHGNQKKTHCSKGHPFAGDNLKVDKGGHRFCRTCEREKARSESFGRLAYECVNGHRYEEGSFFFDVHGAKTCRICRRARKRRQYVAKKARSCESASIARAAP